MAEPEEQKEEQEAEEDQSSNESTGDNVQDKKDSGEDEEWDGEERRSKDRPWSDVEKNEDGEVLSKEEKEALSGDVEELTDEAGVMTYDFYSPAHINKSSLPAFAIINEKIIESMNESLIDLLQREIEITANDIEINRYGDFIHSLPTLVDASIINVSKIDTQAMVCIDGALIEIIMDSYFGGEGKLSEDSEKELFTTTELNLSNKILEMFLKSNKSAWSKTEPLEFQFLQRETQPKLINLISDTDLVVISQFTVSLNEESSYIRIIYPYKSLEPIKQSLRNTVSDNNGEIDLQWKKEFFNSVKAAPIELNTILSEFNLTVEEVVKLKMGDVIPFSMPESVTVYSNATPIFTGKIGSVNDAVAVSIDSWIRNNKY